MTGIIITILSITQTIPLFAFLSKWIGLVVFFGIAGQLNRPFSDALVSDIALSGDIEDAINWGSVPNGYLVYNNAGTYEGLDPSGFTQATQNEVISGDWTFIGDIIFQGSMIEIDSEITTADSVIVFNEGEVGGGVTLGYSGIYVDRGSSNPFWFGYDEVRDALTAGEITALSAAQIATTNPVIIGSTGSTDNVVLTSDGTGGSMLQATMLIVEGNQIEGVGSAGVFINDELLPAAGSTYDFGSVAFPWQDGFFNGSLTAGDITADELDVDNISLDGNTITVTDLNGYLYLYGNGNGIVQIGDAQQYPLHIYRAEGSVNEVTGIDFRMGSGTSDSDNYSYARIFAEILDNTANVQDGALRIFTATNGTNVERINISQDGIVVGNPTGGAKGIGTINAKAVYDDNTLLTDYIFEKAFKNKYLSDVPEWYQSKTLDEEYAFIKKNLHFSLMPGRKAWKKNGAPSTGESISRLLAIAETQFLYINELKTEIENLKTIKS